MTEADLLKQLEDACRKSVEWSEWGHGDIRQIQTILKQLDKVREG